ncbi:MAG: hypothetical protein IKD31_06395 [Clostridia bacterium]|nr:hypothetical protein [Clostridia bacterium]
MKKITVFFAALLAVLSFTAAPKAAKIENLESIYAGLTASIYKPYYEKSPYYEAYRKEIEALSDFLKQPEHPQEEIDRHHEAIRMAFANLMHDSFDYSALFEIAEFYKKMDLSLFTEDSRRGLEKAMEAVFYELKTPTVYQRGTFDTELSYRSVVQENIDSVEESFLRAYSALSFVPPEGPISKDKLEAVLNLCQTTARKDQMSQSIKWPAYEKAVTSVTATLESPSADEAFCGEQAVLLLDAYRNLLLDVLDFMPVSKYVNYFATFDPNTYVSQTWSQFAAAVFALEDVSLRYHFFYTRESCDAASFRRQTDLYFSTITAEAQEALEQLIPLSDFEALHSLCNRYRGLKVTVGLELKHNKVMLAVSRGLSLLSDPESTGSDVAAALADLQEIVSEYERALEFLNENGTATDLQNRKAMQLTLVFSLVSVVLALGFAVSASYKKNGRIDLN